MHPLLVSAFNGHAVVLGTTMFVAFAWHLALRHRYFVSRRRIWSTLVQALAGVQLVVVSTLRMQAGDDNAVVCDAYRVSLAVFCAAFYPSTWQRPWSRHVTLHSEELPVVAGDARCSRGSVVLVLYASTAAGLLAVLMALILSRSAACVAPLTQDVPVVVAFCLVGFAGVVSLVMALALYDRTDLHDVAAEARRQNVYFAALSGASAGWFIYCVLTRADDADVQRAVLPLYACVWVFVVQTLLVPGMLARYENRSQYVVLDSSITPQRIILTVVDHAKLRTAACNYLAAQKSTLERRFSFYVLLHMLNLDAANTALQDAIAPVEPHSSRFAEALQMSAARKRAELLHIEAALCTELAQPFADECRAQPFYQSGRRKLQRTVTSLAR